MGDKTIVCCHYTSGLNVNSFGCIFSFSFGVSLLTLLMVLISNYGTVPNLYCKRILLQVNRNVQILKGYHVIMLARNIVQ